MKKIGFKKLFALVLAVYMIMSIPFNAMATYSSGTPKGLLLYVGYYDNQSVYSYANYSTADITKLSLATTEFVLCSGNTIYNSYQFGNSSLQSIITEYKINNMSASLINNPVDLEDIRNIYLGILNGEAESTLSFSTDSAEEYSSEETIDVFGYLDPRRYEIEEARHRQQFRDSVGISINNSLDALADDVIDLVETIVSVIPNATIWLPFPLIAFPSLSAEFTTPFQMYVDYLKNNLGYYWNANIRGFYWGTEAVPQYYTPMNYNMTATNGFGNPLIQLMISLDNWIGQYGKSFLWIPYIPNNQANVETLTRNGYVANRTTIFDYILFQPGHYFKGADAYANFELIKTCVQQNKAYDRNNNIIGGSKVYGGATIGYEMELDERVTQVSPVDYNTRYWTYTSKFATYKSYPHMFYASDRNSVCGSSSGAVTCYNYVKTWLTS